MSSDFCAFCFGPLGTGNHKTVRKNDRAYHADCAAKDKPVARASDRYTLPSGVKVGGRGADWIEKHGG